MNCTCGKPTKDNAYVCEDCLTALAKALGDVPWLDEELDISITRQKASALGGGSRSRTTPLPWHEKASDAKRALHGLLATWVRFCAEEHVRDRGADAAWPADNLTAMSRWLLWRVDGLAFHDLGGDAVDEITNAVAQGERIVFWRKRERVYLGPCGTALTDESACDGDVYADAGQEFGYCQACGFPFKVDARRAALEQQLDDRLCTASEIARLAVYLGLDQSREQVRNRVNQWHSRNRISPNGHNPDGDPVFRYGEVRALLATLRQQAS